jgi:phenylacetate-CoA ligase
VAYGDLRLYNGCPPALRSLAASAYGIATRRQRFGWSFRRCSAELEVSQWLPTAEVQRGSLVRAAAFAREARVAGTADVAGDGGWLRSCPVLTKDAFRGDPGRYLRPELPGGVLHRHTSGTTGRPLLVLLTRAAFQREHAFAWQHRAWHGCPRGVRTATLAGHPVVPPARKRPPYWTRNLADNQLIFSSYHMSRSNLPAYARALAEFRPALIHGYPSSIALVAATMRECGLRWVPRAVITASETLLPHQREVIRDAFGVEPRIWYGNTEQAGNIVECPAGRLHVREEHSLVELLDEDGAPAALGRPARLVATAFENPASLLVRYDTGDLAVPSAEEACPCGRAGRLVEQVVGRVEDYVIDADGRLIGRLDHLFKHARGVREAQLVQEIPGDIVVRIVTADRPGEEIERPIREEAARRLAPGTRLVFEYADHLERGPGGKVGLVISRLARSSDPLREFLAPHAR